MMTTFVGVMMIMFIIMIDHDWWRRPFRGARTQAGGPPRFLICKILKIKDIIACAFLSPNHHMLIQIN
jgi:hypothetical protein